MDPIQKLARRLRGVERLAFKAATQPQLAYSSIEDGAIQSVVDGSLKAIIGQQYDGTQAVVIVNGPVPPEPSAPTGDAALEGAILRWDGTFVGDAVVPLDFARVELHVSTDPDFTAEFAETLKATFETPRGGEVFVSLVPATYYAKLVTRTSSGLRSTPSAAFTVTPQALVDSLPAPTDGTAPTDSPLPNVAGGVGALFVSWAPSSNPDPVTYEVHISTTSGFTPDSTTLAAETAGNLAAIKNLPGDGGADLEYDVDYYIRIIAKDVDGAGPPSIEVYGSPKQVNSPDIAAGSVAAEHILAGEVTAEKLASVMALLSELYVGDKISITPSDGIRITLNNGGYIHFPADGTDAELIKVVARFTQVIVEDNMQILGANNRVGGQLTLDASINPPATAPVVASVYDQSPISVSPAIPGQNFGLGDNGTEWEIGQHTSFSVSESSTTSYGTSTFTVYKVNKTTGARTTKYSFAVDLYTYWGTSPSPVTPTLTSFHSNATRAVFMVYVPAISYVDREGSTVTVAAHYQVLVVNNSTGALLNSWTWSTYASWKFPAVFTDGTYVFVGASNKSNADLYMYRYAQNGTGGTNLWISADHTADWSGLYIGNADFGGLRYVLTYSGTSVHVFNSTGTLMTSELFTKSNNESPIGINYDGTRFVSYHTTGKLRKYSTLTTSPSRSVKYTWYNLAGGIESTASPAATVTQNIRQWLQVAASEGIPASSDTQSPDAIRIYVDSHRQTPDLSAGVVTKTYEVPGTAGADSPATDGFLAINARGAIQSEALDAQGAVIIDLEGDGSGRVGPLRWDADGKNIDAEQASGSTVTYSPTAAVGGQRVANLADLVFTAPASGRVMIMIGAYVLSKTAGQSAVIAPEVRSGGTIGAGTVVYANNFTSDGFGNYNTAYVHGWSTAVVDNLTPGATYNTYAYVSSSGSAGATWTLGHAKVIPLP